MPENLPPVLILCDDPGFSAAVESCWSSKPDAPAFQSADSTTWQQSQAQQFDLLILASLPAAVRDSALQACEAAGTPALVALAEPHSVDEVRSRHPQALVIRRHESALEELVALADAALRLGQVSSRAERAERLLAEMRPLAEVGRFVLESRHKINNTLSSVLGNAELLLVEPETIGPQARTQIRAIHNMSLRLYELVQRMAAVETDARKAGSAMPGTSPRSRTLLTTPSRRNRLDQPNRLS